jgi:glycosyltransferase involved in cell wall biosynthesis
MTDMSTLIGADTPRRIAFISTRISGTDGLSLEVAKWAEVLERMGHQCFYIAGQCDDRPEERSHIIPEAHFTHPVIAEINRQCFGVQTRKPEVSEKIREMSWIIKEKLRAGLARFEADIVIAENCVTIPMNIPLGLAVVETVMETGIGCIAHHHDFVWERERFMVNAVADYIQAAFPPHLSEMQHIAINSVAAAEFSRRTGLPCRVIPNVMDFANPPAADNEYGRNFRRDIGLGEHDFLVLQPTRIVQRKGIETSIELLRRLNDPRCKLVVTHSAGDEGDTYSTRVRSYAELLGVEVVYAEQWIGDERFVSADGRKRYSIWDAYRHADLVTYPSTYEGFGNAFLEAIYFGKPILCNRYSIYRTDIEPCGFDAILMEGYLTDEVVERVRKVLDEPELRREMVEHNYQVACQFFSYDRVEAELNAILSKPRLALACTP